MTAELALLDRGVNDLLPNGSRLMERLQSAVSTAVKAPLALATGRWPALYFSQVIKFFMLRLTNELCQ